LNAYGRLVRPNGGGPSLCDDACGVLFDVRPVERLHSSLGDIPPSEFEHAYYAQIDQATGRNA